MYLHASARIFAYNVCARVCTFPRVSARTYAYSHVSATFCAYMRVSARICMLLEISWWPLKNASASCWHLRGQHAHFLVFSRAPGSRGRAPVRLESHVFYGTLGQLYGYSLVFYGTLRVFGPVTAVLSYFTSRSGNNVHSVSYFTAPYAKNENFEPLLEKRV